MYYSKFTNVKIIKNILLVVIISICLFMMIKGCGGNSVFDTERDQLNKNINTLQIKYDSLQKASDALKINYVMYQSAYVKDSITIDSLGLEIIKQTNKTVLMEKKADSYLSKYNKNNDKILMLENNKNYKTGDNLIESLSEKINK